MAAVYGVREKLRILCTRDLQNSIKESFHAELRSAIASTPWLQSHYEVGESYIRGKNGTEFLFKGLRHNMAAIKSMAQIDLCIVEEAEDVLEESLIDLIPTIRAERSEIWFIWNPKMEGSPVDQRMRRHCPQNAIIMEVNYRDNPWFPAVLEAERLNDLATLDAALYKHIWEGAYLVDNEFSLIRYDVVREAFDRKVGYLTHTKIMGVDVGMSLTGDPSALGVRQGPAVTHMEEFNYDDTFSIAGRIRNRAEELGVNYIVVDAISWGKGVADVLAGWNLPVMKLNVGEVASERERFFNLKAELWWKMAEWFNELQCSIFPFDLRTRLAMELCAPKYGYNPNGKIFLEKKQDMLKRGIKSTNLADCLMHTMMIPSLSVTSFGPSQTKSRVL
jgi:phage terminase large subunit